MKLALVTAALAASTAAAQGTLAEFLEAADSANVDRRISVEQRNRAAAEHRQAWTALLPSLSAQASWTHNQYEAKASFPDPATGTVRELVIIPGDQFDAVFRVDLPLIDTGRWFRAMAAAKSEESATLRELVTRDLVRRQVVSAYYAYGAALALRDSAKKSAAVAQAQLKLMEIRTGAGASTELELLRAKSEAQRMKQVVTDTGVLVATSRRTLRTLTGLEPPEALALPPDDLSPEAALETLERNVEQLPAVQAADRDAAAAGTMANASRLALVPTVGAQYTQRLTNATGFQGQSAVYNFGVNLQWRLDVPTFMGMQATSAGEQTAALASERARLVARDQLFSDYQRLDAALSKVESARVQAEVATRAAQVARDRYAAGAATQLDVITAERDLFTAEVGQIQARTELGTAHASVRLSAGLPVQP